MQLKGKLTKWNAEKGFGFIAPFAGGSQIFVHATAFENRLRVPKINDVITFTVDKDRDGRTCAKWAYYAGEKRLVKKTKNNRTFSMIFAIGFLLGLSLASYMGDVPKPIKYYYYVITVLTLFLYAHDKIKAKRNTWRTPESTLHFFALIGGWPGARIAQQVLRHKSSKQDFISMYSVTVVANLAALGWLLSPYGEKFLKLILDAVRFI
jgi:uncharacterized membrane protein YsdA (DUF1294 family)/cold shock CspA family protein